MRLLIYADDLGHSPLVNQTIIELFTLGRITSISLLVNMPYSQSAVHDLHAHPDLEMGVHLNLTKGSPFKTIMELIIHPGKRDDPDFPPDTLLTHQRQWEYDFLLSPGFDAWLEMMEAKMVNYLTLSHFTK